MFNINYDDMSIDVTRGDVVFFSVSAEENGESYIFTEGDVIRFKAFKKKDAKTVVLQKDFYVARATDIVSILLTGQETKFGEVISKPVEYWYEIELNPFTNPQTIIGYDDDGAKIITLYPEGKDIVDDIPESDMPAVDGELALTSTKPVQNQAIARAIVGLRDTMDNYDLHVKEVVEDVLRYKDINVGIDYDEITEALNINVRSIE